MASFLVFEPQDGSRAQADAERVIFLRERFSVFAFVFAPFWLLRHRLWLGFLLWLVLFLALSWIGNRLGYGPYAALAAWYVPGLIFGFEGTNLRARKYTRKGYREAAVVIADDLETAERRFFESWKQSAPVTVPKDQPQAAQPAPVAYPAAKFAAPAEPGVIGMFPTPEQR